MGEFYRLSMHEQGIPMSFWGYRVDPMSRSVALPAGVAALIRESHPHIFASVKASTCDALACQGLPES